MIRKINSKKILLQIIILLMVVCCSKVAAVNWNSIEVNDVEYYIQTDKSTYQLGEDVEMLYRITNNSDNDITFTLPGSPPWNFSVEAGGDEIWVAVDAWWTVVVNIIIAPGESEEFPELSSPYVWDMRDDGGDMVSSGSYIVYGGLYGWPSYLDSSKVSVPIEVIPEPATISFLLFFAPVLRVFSGRNRQGLNI